MIFSQPWAVWFLAGVPVIVALYFLRHQRRARRVSTHLFWQRAANETSRRALFQRLRHVLSLLLQLLIFGLIVAALARPSLEQALPSGASTVIVLDARARMQVVEADGQTRFAQAVARARSEAARASDQRQTALVVLEAQAVVAVPFVADEKPLVEALARLAPVDAGGDAAAALSLADTLLASREGEKRMVWLSDRPAPAGLALTAPVESAVVGKAHDNLAITRLATRPLPGNPETSEILLEVQNFGANPATTEVDFSFDGRTVEVKPLVLAAGERKQEIFPSVIRPGRNARGWLVARLAGTDALPLDNVAYALLPPLRPARVLLVSTGNPFLEKFLGVDATIKYQVIQPDAWQASLAPKFEVVIFDRVVPPGFDLAKAEGNYLFLNQTPFSTGPALDQPLVTEVEVDHPSTRHVSLQNVSILRAGALAIPPSKDGWQFRAPLRSFEHALLLTGERQPQRLAALAFDVLESDLPLRVAFPLLMSNTLSWLAGERMETARTLSAGESLALAEGELVAPEPLVTPPSKAPVGSVARIFQPLRNGYYAVQAGDAPRWLAVNTFDAAESDLRGAGGGRAAILPERLASPWTSWPLWQWLAVVALVLFSLEWWLFHRRKTE